MDSDLVSRGGSDTAWLDAGLVCMCVCVVDAYLVDVVESGGSADEN